MKRLCRNAEGVPGLTKKEAEIQRNLIVAAPSRMEFCSCGTDTLGEFGLDVHVNIFQITAELEDSRFDVLSNLDKPLFDQGKLFNGQDAGS